MEIPRKFPSKRLAESTTIPPLLLTFAFACLFIFQNDGHSFQFGHHGFLSSHGMTVSAHLSPEHNFLMLNRVLKNADGSVRYSIYNRFPIGAFASIRLATWPFQHDLSMQVSIARNLMNTFFAAAAYVAYLSLLRLSKSKWVAVTATLLAFSSYYCLYYNDMIFNDVPTMFGLLLAFHGMVVFVQDGRFRQLIVKSCVALFFGWQVYALLVPFTLVGCAIDLVKTRSLRSFVQSRYFLLGTTALLFGMVILTSNLAGEYFATDTPLRDLPTVKKMLWRFGLAGSGAYEAHEDHLVWANFLQEQAYRIGKMSLPYTISNLVTSPVTLTVWGRIVLAISIVAAVCSRWRILTISLVVSGLCWALPMRHFVAFHDFQSIYYIGLPLFAYYLLALSVKHIPKIRVGLAYGALLLFLYSSIQLNIQKATNTDTGYNILTADFQRISDQVTTQHAIFINGDHSTMAGGFHAVSFYLARNYIVSTREEAEFIISTSSVEDATLLTPHNKKVFLYAPATESNTGSNTSDQDRKSSMLLNLTVSSEADSLSDDGEIWLQHANDGATFGFSLPVSCCNAPSSRTRS